MQSAASSHQVSPDTVRTIAIAGNPNSGKTALFNLLTGTHQKIANFPGVTVEKKEGFIVDAAANIKVIDLPGTYSLDAETPDELIAQQILLGLRQDTALPEAVLVVVDSTHLERSLYLVSQLMEFGLPLVLCLNMMDLAEKQGLQIDLKRAAQLLSFPVIPTVAIKAKGKDELLQWFEKTDELRPVERPFKMSPVIEQRRQEIAEDLRRQAAVPESQIDFWAGKILTGRWQRFRGDQLSKLGDVAKSWEQRLVAVKLSSHEQTPNELTQAEIEARHHWCEELYQKLVTQSYVQRSLSDRIDRVALHPIFGPLIFLVVMALVFQAVFSWATPMMDVLGMGFAWLGSLLASWLPESPWRGLLIDGALTGVGAVVVFIPQILLLFLFISILEDSGYLARAAFLVDRLMVRSGLSGKSFIPLLSSFACAIPGIMATRTIKNERDRLATIMVAPLMTCSARLPVYALLIGAFIPNRTWWGLKLPGVVLFALYLLGMLGAVVVAKVMRATVLKGPRSMLVLELPDYHMPNWRNIAIGLWTRVKLFLRRAGKIILTASIILWFLCSYPRHEKHLAEMRQSGASEAVLKTEIIENSFAGKIGKFIEPVIRPLGYDWKVGIGLLASLAAREVFVSTMATIYSVEDDTADADSLRSALQSDRNPRTGKALFSVAMVCGLLVFFSFAMQCVSTVAVIRRETNSWRWPLFALLYTYVLAYVLAFTTFQILNFWL